MNKISTLLEKYWICKDNNKEEYYQVKRDIPLFQKFIQEQLGWKLIHTEHLIKLEKVPAHAESFMGIQEFSDIRDYTILCAVLMFLEDKAEQEQFLLSELIRFVETCLKQYMEIDWTSFTQRKSLVRVLQYMENLDIHKNAAFWMLESEDRYGRVHPRDAMLPEIVQLISTDIRKQLENGILDKQENEIILIKKVDFENLVLQCREKWSEAWSKEYREMEERKLIKNVRNYMTNWMMIRCRNEEYEILPTAGKITAVYPKDYK